jgi:hypothetical protein
MNTLASVDINTSLFDSMPGVEMPVGQIMPSLNRMWSTNALDEEGCSRDCRAIQLNLVLHLGKKTDAKKARELFEVALEFARVCPSRIIVLCPQIAETEGLRAKLFAQCYMAGPASGTLSCEALILGYPLGDGRFLEDQVSVWLDNDLPTYYWFNGVPLAAIAENYLAFLHGCRRIIYDSAIEGECLKGIKWPRSNMLSDLAWGRTLSLRRVIGQFCARYAPAVLVKGLKSVKIESCPDRLAQAQCLLDWHERALRSCGAAADVKYECVTSTDLVHVTWTYDVPECKFEARSDCDGTSVSIVCTLDKQISEKTAALLPIHPAQVLRNACLGE